MSYPSSNCRLNTEKQARRRHNLVVPSPRGESQGFTLITRLSVCLALALITPAVAAQPFSISQQSGKILITAEGKPVATYVYNDKTIPRPYFKDVHAPGGVKITRNHPPIEGQDLTDHPTYHPGVWLAFGDISGADFWRNQAQVRHAEFVKAPWTKDNEAGFTVLNVYEANGEVVCKEECAYQIVADGDAYYLLHESRFFNDTGFVFGDQEEMGLGIRVRTKMTVDAGDAYAVNSHGQRNEDGAWGKQADWAAYAGPVDDAYLGALIAGHPDNFRQSWYHIRDYGLIIANLFGRAAYTDGDPSAVHVEPGNNLTLRYGIAVVKKDSRAALNLNALYQRYLELAANYPK